jgi:hypothetical protein
MQSFLIMNLCRFFIICFLSVSVLSLEMQISRGGRHPINCFKIFNPSTFLCLSQARTWISLVNLSFHNLLDVVYLNENFSTIMAENFIYFYNKIHSLDLKKHKRDTEESV